MHSHPRSRLFVRVLPFIAPLHSDGAGKPKYLAPLPQNLVIRNTTGEWLGRRAFGGSCK